MGALASLALSGLSLAKAGWEAFCAFLGKLDGRGWVELIASLIAAALLLHFAMDARHWRKQDARDVKALQVEKDHEAAIAKHAIDLKTKIDGLTANITQTIKEQNDAENARIAADANAVRLRGPGKAACPGRTGTPVLPSGPVAPAPVADATGPQVPAGDWAAVPWSWLVQRGEEFDRLLAEVTATRNQHEQLEQAWPNGAAIQAKPAQPYSKNH